ncbi:MAG: bifunctional diaminohydroxyphosphoribosylaminopyrimidine deaminase/5-amino-6-(5-phosphoribosylamino)uracil reductase RibD [Flavitalea sp.]
MNESVNLHDHEKYMRRCIELAAMGAGKVAPNPMVGAVLVHNQKIIGEGYHKVYGGPHAEVNCLNSVSVENQHLVPSSTIYISLEPCAHHGKTPPCADLIIHNKIPRVIVGCRDPFTEVDGKGIEKLLAAGVDVTTGILEDECKKLNKRFLTFHTSHRPYIILKWAQTKNKIIGVKKKRLYITGSVTNRLVHKWRSEESSILIGTNTAAADDPQLSNRLWTDNSPVRIVIDKELHLPASLQLLNGSVKTIVFNTIRHEQVGNILYYQVANDVNLVHQIVHALHQLNILSVIVEGGATLLQSFIDENLWDEARIITNQEIISEVGITAPVLSQSRIVYYEELDGEEVTFFEPSYL